MLYFSYAAFSDLSLSRCLLLFISPCSNPLCFQIFFYFIRCIASHFIRLRERKGLINAFSSILDGIALCFLCLLVYVMIRTSLLPATCFFCLVCTRYDVYARIYIPSSSPSCIFYDTELTISFLYPLFILSFPPLLAVVPRFR